LVMLMNETNNIQEVQPAAQASAASACGPRNWRAAQRPQYTGMSPRAYVRFLVLLVALLPMSLRAQSAFKGLALPATVNTAYDELVPRLSPDDQTLYFVRFQHPENVGGRGGGQDIWYSTRTPEGWAAARNAGAVLNNTHHNFVGAVVDQGNALLLGNTYGASITETTPGIALSRRNAGQWSAPTTVLSDKSFPKDSKFIDFYATPDGSVLLVSLLTDGTGHEDLAVCFDQGNGHYTPPQPLGDIINTEAGYETAPFLSADTKTLFFCSNGLGGQGDADIFMSTRLDDSWSNWSEPVNLGPQVNTAGFDGHFIIDSRWDKAYFVSGPSPTALGDIYEIPVADIPALKRQQADTLRIYTQAGTPYDLDLESYGINPANARFVSLKPIDGPGLITPGNDKDAFVYRPAGVFEGREHIALTLCDPPQSDNCRQVIVEANVGKPAVPMVQQIALRTPKNQMLDVNADIAELSMAETRRNYKLQGSKGELMTPAGINPAFIFRPERDFVGMDSVRLYGGCPNGETSNCLKAIVKIEVYDIPAVVVVVDTPKVVIPVVVVDTPKVVIPVVVVDTPKVVAPVVVIDTPKLKNVTISGIVTDEKTGRPLGAEVVFYDQNVVVGSTMSDSKTGAYKMTLPSVLAYRVNAKLDPYYFPYSDMVSTAGRAALKGEVQKDIALTPVPLEAGQTFVLKNIYFDLDKTILKPESKDELTRLHELLSNYPSMEIQVNGHTDSQASDAYNQQLSEGRAAAVVNYLKYKGVMGYRMRSAGFGEKVPVATNETEAGRALNRRVEFTILKIDN
jgi:outer membrane protein OmpA-like peptidoglycan-associated protein